jgi:hypothetical protein
MEAGVAHDRQARLRQLAALESDAAGADGPDLRCRRAGLLDALGRTEEAKGLFLDILAGHPCHAATLNAFGALLYRTGYRKAARTVFAQAVSCHPDSADGQINLGNVLREAGDLPGSRAAFAAALAAAPGHPQAHQGFGDLLDACGDREGAARHWRLGYAGHAVQGWTYRGAGAPVRVLMPISVANGNMAARAVLDDQVFAVTTLAMEFFGPGDVIPPHDVVLNAIGDADLCAEALRAAACLVARTTAKVINPPACVLRTGRAAMLAALAGFGDVVVPRVALVDRKALLGGGGAGVLAEYGMGWPVLLRAPGFHTGRHFALVRDADGLEAAASALPGAALLAIEYLPAVGGDGCFRKGRMMVIGGQLFALHWAISADWKVHYFTADMAGCVAHRAEEARFLADAAGFLGRRAVAGLLAVADRLGLDYGGIDFGLLDDGRIVVFEANATMALVAPPDEALWRYRRPAYDAALLAAQTLVIRGANGYQPARA